MNTEELLQQIAKLEAKIKEARAKKDFDEVESIYQQLFPLEEKYDKIQQELRYQKELQEMSDFYDDDKNRDAYNMRVIEELCGDIIDRPLQV